MNLGSSMRRRRPPGGRGPKEGKKAQRATGGGGRLLLFAVGIGLAGSLAGYLYASHVLYAAPETEAEDLRSIPDVRGMALEEAETFLRETGLQLGIVDSIHHPDVMTGQVLGQSPLPGQLGLPAADVELSVSLGPERRPVPDVSRLRVDRAITVLQTTGFLVLVDSVDADVPEGRVVATEPEAGTELSLPSEVRLNVSLGPALMPMPDLVGLQEAWARNLLASMGLEVGEVETRFRFGFNQGEILEHFPPADSLIAQGGTVRLVVGREGFFQGP